MRRRLATRWQRAGMARVSLLPQPGPAAGPAPLCCPLDRPIGPFVPQAMGNTDITRAVAVWR
jgi:hypothetical protein